MEKKAGYTRYLQRILAVLFWLLLWQIASMVLNKSFLLVSPLEAGKRFLELVFTAGFWKATGGTMLRIMCGFFLAVAAGILLAAASASREWVRVFLAPLVTVIRTVPVVSFVILALILISSRYLCVLISFLMAFPVIYENVLKGILQCDPALLEMAGVFGVSGKNRLLWIYIPGVFPYFRPAFSTALSFAWKSGIAAEVIGMPTGSVGERMQQAKIYLASADLIAWTIAVVLCSQLLLFLGNRVMDFVQQGYGRKRHPVAGDKTAQGTGPQGAAEGAAGEKEKATEARKEETAESPQYGAAPRDILVDHIDKSFGDRVVFRDYSCVFKGGEISVLSQPSGFGKTTLFRLILGLDAPDRGNITGMEGRRPGVVFQEDRLLLSMDVYHNLRLVSSGVSAAAMEEALEAVGLGDRLYTPVEELSGGMQRRVALLRALLADWDYLILDEAFRGLDQETKRMVMDYVLRERKGRSILMAAHEPEEAEYMQGEADFWNRTKRSPAG